MSALTDLAQPSFVRQNAQSSMAGEQEYSFWHVLGATSPTASCRADRAPSAMRRRPPGWRRSWASASTILPTCSPTTGGNALELSRAAGQDERAFVYEPKAIAFLVRAGDRARGLDSRPP